MEKTYDVYKVLFGRELKFLVIKFTWRFLVIKFSRRILMDSLSFFQFILWCCCCIVRIHRLIAAFCEFIDEKGALENELLCSTRSINFVQWHWIYFQWYMVSEVLFKVGNHELPSKFIFNISDVTLWVLYHYAKCFYVECLLCSMYSVLW